MLTIPEEYEVLISEKLEDIGSFGTLLRHRQSGARVMLIENEDTNKVFNIAFRTPPTDSTGVAHILEHSVLCGSEKFPLKDPFVELVKGSLNTFLNAMTYPDKTMYPAASCNDQDFKNLMDVYLDAVFHPNIYHREEIFLQEGWRYKLEGPEDPLTYNGVVYNEMKGAFSSAEEMVDREIFNTLFPDTPYGVESGGDPRVIPELSYQDFLDFHGKYYHPCNSYIYLYGKMDMEERLRWLDKEYLSNYHDIRLDSQIQRQKAFEHPVQKEIFYPIGDQETEEQNTYLTWSAVVGDCMDVEKTIALQVLEHVLLEAPGAPLKQALLDAKIGKDVYGALDDNILQPFFTVAAKNADRKDLDRFLQIIEATLQELAEKGLDQTALEAAINMDEFRFREADYSSFPRGLMYGLEVFSTWLYDDSKPFTWLHRLQIMKSLRERVGTGYYEELIRECLLSNRHSAIVIAEPKRGLLEEQEEAVKEKLAKIKEAMTDEEIGALIKKGQALKAYQNAEESPEALASIPMLKRSDINRKTPIRIFNEENTEKNIPVLYHKVATNGIAYMTLYFDEDGVSDEDLPYLGLLKSVIGSMDTAKYSFSHLTNLIDAGSGGFAYGNSVLSQYDDTEKYTIKFGIKIKCLYDQMGFVFTMLEEILTSTKIEDEKRLYEIIARIKSRLSVSISSAGHGAAVGRITSYHSSSGLISEMIDGISYYKFIEALEENFQEKKDEIIARLRSLAGKIFVAEGMMIDLTAEEEGYKTFASVLPDFHRMLPGASMKKAERNLKPEKKNEGFKTASQVQYVGMGGNFRQLGYDYKGTMAILRPILSYEYLWNKIRVDGGAYGCMGAFMRNGNAYMVSFRDPELARSLQIYKETPNYLRNFSADETTMTKFIIGTISGMDLPATPMTVGATSFAAWASKITEEDFQKEREEILDAQAEDIRKLADIVEAVLGKEELCVVGNSSAIEKEEACFLQVKALIGKE